MFSVEKNIPMQKLLISLILLGLGLTASAQSQAGLDENIERYIQATENKDWEGVMDLIYPKLFNLVTREQMIQVFESLDGEGMEFDFKQMEVDSISAFFSHEGEVFALVDYTGEMSIKLTGEQYSGEEVLDLMLSSFRAAYGEEQVELDREVRTFSISLDKSMYAITAQDSDQWRFIENNEGQEAILDSLIPAAVRTHFNPEK